MQTIVASAPKSDSRRWPEPAMIQNLTLQQIDEIAPMWSRLNEFHKTLDAAINKQARTGTWAERRSELLTKCAHGSLLQVALVGDAQVGYCISSVSKEGVGEIDSLYVEPHIRKQGIGTQFVETALAWLSRQGCDNIKLWVHPGNTEAIAFYWRFGFATGPEMHKLANKSLERTRLRRATQL